MSTAKINTQFSIFLVNKPGVLGSVTSALSKAGINIFALSLADSGEHGVLRIVGNDDEAIRNALQESHDRWTETDVIVIPIENTPGAFAGIASRFSENNIDISYSYCTASEDGGETAAVFKCKDMQKAMELFQPLRD